MKVSIKQKILSTVLAIGLVLQMGIPTVYAEDNTHPQGSKTITAFTALSEVVKNRTVPVGTTELQAKEQMPTALTATYVETATGSAMSITIENITWTLDAENSNSDVFDSQTKGQSYTFVANVPAADSDGDVLIIAEGATLPSVVVQIEAAIPVTELWLGETCIVTESIIGNTNGSGWRYDSASRTLSLDGTHITSAAAQGIIKYKEDTMDFAYFHGLYCIGDLNLIVSGENTIDLRAFSNERSYGILIHGTLTVSGNGKLSAGGMFRGVYVFNANLKVSQRVELEGVVGRENELSTYTVTAVGVTNDIIVTDTAHLIGHAYPTSRNIGVSAKNVTIKAGATVSAFADEGFNADGASSQGMKIYGGLVTVEGTLLAQSGNAGDRGNGATGIYLDNADLVVSGTGSVQATAGTPGAGGGSNAYGICVNQSGEIIVNGGGFLAYGGSNAIIPFTTMVTITENPVLYAVSANRDGSNATPYNSAEAWEAVNGNFGAYKYIKATSIYEVYVNGTQVTRLNRHDVLGDGAVSYIPASGDATAQLKLKDSHFDGTIDLKESTEVILSGDNTVGAIQTTSALRLSGDGEMTVTGSLDCSNANLTLASEVTLQVEGNITAEALIHGGTLVNNGSITVTDTFTGSGAVVNQGTLILPSSTDTEVVKGFTGVGLSEVKGANTSPSTYFSQGNQLTVRNQALDFTKASGSEANQGGWKADATLSEEGYHWASADKILTLQNLLLQETTENALTLPADTVLVLKGVNIIVTENNVGIAAASALTMAGSGSLRMTSDSGFEVEAESLLLTEDVKLHVNGIQNSEYPNAAVTVSGKAFLTSTKGIVTGRYAQNDDATVEIVGENTPAIMTTADIDITGGNLTAQSNRPALVVLDRNQNGAKITLSEKMRIVTPTGGKVITAQMVTQDDLVVTSILPFDEAILRLELGNADVITDSNGARAVILSPKLEQEPLRMAAITPKTYGDEAFTLSISGGSGTGAVTFMSSDPEVISVTGSSVTIHKKGEFTIMALKASDSTYLGTTTSSQAITVAKRGLTVKADDKLDIIRGAAMPAFTYTVTGLAGKDTFTEPVISATAVGTETVGEFSLTISGGTLTNAESYQMNYVSGRLSIVPPVPENPNPDTPTPDDPTPNIPDGSGDSGGSGNSGRDEGGSSKTGGGSSSNTSSETSEKLELQKATLTTHLIEKLIQEASSAVELSSGPVTFKLDLETLKAIQAQVGSDVVISAAKADSNKLSEEIRAIIGTRPIFEFSLTGVEGKKITQFGTGIIKISIPYSLQTGEKAENIGAYYIDDNGNIEEIPNALYDENSKMLVFETSHFSKYAIGFKVNVGFVDISSHWAKSDIEFVTSKGLFSGTGKSFFSPNLAITRGMFITVMGKMAKVDVSAYDASRFIDVAADAYYSPYIQWASEAGIASGLSADVFAPDQQISREQMTVMLSHYANALKIALPNAHPENLFADQDEVSVWAKDAVKMTQMTGLISGKPKNVFDPKGTATRAEASAVIRKLFEWVSNK